MFLFSGEEGTGGQEGRGGERRGKEIEVDWRNERLSMSIGKNLRSRGEGEDRNSRNLHFLKTGGGGRWGRGGRIEWSSECPNHEVLLFWFSFVSALGETEVMGRKVWIDRRISDKKVLFYFILLVFLFSSGRRGPPGCRGPRREWWGLLDQGANI